MDVLEIFRDVPKDIQELLIHAMAKDSRQYLASWSYDGETKTITLHCLHELFCSDQDVEECLFRPILVALLSGIPQKVVVYTGYLDRVSYLGDLGWYRPLDRRLVLESDEFEKNWFRDRMPEHFCVEFVLQIRQETDSNEDWHDGDVASSTPSN